MPDYLVALQATQYPLTPKSKWKTLRHCLNVLIFGHVYNGTHGKKHDRRLMNQWFLWKGIYMDTPLAGFLCERQLDKVIGKKHKPWNQQCQFLSVYVYDINMAGEKDNLKPMWKHVDLETPTSFLDRFVAVLNANVNRRTVSLTSTEHCAGHECPQEQLKSCQIQGRRTKKVIAWFYDLAGHAHKCVERYCELANNNIEQFVSTIIS